jgi:hypothetical protein
MIDLHSHDQVPGAGQKLNLQFYRQRSNSCKRRLQSLFLGLVERAAHDCAAGAAQCGEHLLGRLFRRAIPVFTISGGHKDRKTSFSGRRSGNPRSSIVSKTTSRMGRP